METMQITPEKLWNEGVNHAADAVVISLDRKILLIQRKSGNWALPGGFVDKDESSADAALRETLEEANVVLGSIGSQCFEGRVDDPRNSEDRWIESTGFVFLTDTTPEPIGSDDAMDARWWDLAELPPLYGSHRLIVENALTLMETTSDPLVVGQAYADISSETLPPETVK